MADIQCFTLTVLVSCLCMILQVSHAQTYRAAVVAFKDESNSIDLPNEMISKNQERYVSLINDLKNQVDLVVFPEYGITTIKILKLPRLHLKAYAIKVPAILPVDDLKNDLLSAVSLAAKSSGIYVVINVLEQVENPEKFYSTSLVFDSNGTLIMKCRKKRVETGVSFDGGDMNQKCTFEAQFKNQVKFALLFDSDIPFDMPYKTIHNVILTSSLQNKLPFSIGPSLHVAYAVGNQVNLLVSEYTKSSESYGGTGIYLMDGSSKVTINSKLILDMDVPISKDIIYPLDVKVSVEEPLDENIGYEVFPTNNATGNELNFELGDHSYCTLSMKLNKSNIEPYKWVTLLDTQNILGQPKKVIICGLIKPKESVQQKSYVEKVDIRAVTEKSNIAQILPLALGNNSKEIYTNFQFTKEGDEQTKAIIKLTNTQDLSVFGIIIFLKDGVSYGTSIHFSPISLLGFLPIIVILCSYYNI